VVLLAYPDCQSLDVTGPFEVFAMAHEAVTEAGLADPGYALALAGPEAGPMRCSSGLGLVADASWRSLRGPIDTFLVAGGAGVREMLGDEALVRFVARLEARTRRIASVCSGSFLLAQAGLLDGRTATTHWANLEQLAAAFPAVDVDPDRIFVRDGPIITSAGVTAGMDMALALVEEDCGREVALQVARRLVLFLKRPGGQSQFSTQLSQQLAERAPLRELQAWIAANPEADLSVEALARRVAMSSRNFARVFARETGVTPARYVERARVEVARRRLEESQAGVEAVAVECGFGSLETLRRAFLRNLNVTPQDYRVRFRATPQRARAG
jgi:transcriptional regulator GlxA family with amidase domain